MSNAPEAGKAATRARFWDATGVGLSGLCLVHCLALPAAAAFLPVLAGLAEGEWVHWVFVAIAAPAAFIAIAPALTDMPLRARIPAFAICGLMLLLAGAFEFPNHVWGEGLTICGGLSLATAHILNWRRGHLHHNHGCRR